MDAHKLRQLYLGFFKSRGHAVIGGASLIPEHDPSVLFTTAGMHPLVPFLMGEPHPAGKRLTNVQKCLRTDDIAEVGDDVHLTFFEMLGNWSLGDYWKREAIQMSYEFLTEQLGLEPDRLRITCFAGDEHAPRDLKAAYLKFCGKELENAHCAEEDAKASAEVLMGQLEVYEDLPRDVSGLCSYCNEGRENYVDAGGRFVWREEEAVFNFGKHSGRTLCEITEDYPDYLGWILRQDFSPEVEEIVANALSGEFPQMK